MPQERTGCGWYRDNNWLHTDQSYQRNGFECLQSWVTSFDVNKGDATLTFLEGSNRYHGDFAKRFGSNPGDWNKLANNDEVNFYIQEKGCIRCPAGSMVFWDSRTIHVKRR